MNQEKIGKFIAKLRKDKKMTQQELANKLNVTDRAVSHWENGRRLPDVSLFKAICEIFDISVNELISGEKISKDKIVKKSDENIINTLNDREKNKRKSKKVIVFLLIGIVFLTIFSIKNTYPKIDIYNFTISPADPDKTYSLKKEITHKNRSIYYYGIDTAIFCDKKEKCYQVKDAIKNNQTTIDSFQRYLEKQVEYENVKIHKLYDGGTLIYEKAGFLVIYCNTMDGNRDLYIGNSEMLDNLNGEYCGYSKNFNQSYVRTYKVISSSINQKDSEFNDVILEQNNGVKGNILINNSYVLVPGKNYEFSFLTFDKFDDTIENIFKYSTLLKIVETDKNVDEQINEKIFVNENFQNKVELNELEHVSMVIKDGTLTKTSATLIITDFSGYKYVYGSDFRLDVKEGDKWNEVQNICDNCAFNSMAYRPDKNGYLKFDINWERMYGKLSKGRYRIVREALIEKEECSEVKCNKYYFSVEFDID